MKEKNGYIREYLSVVTEILASQSTIDIEEVIEILSKARALGRKIFIFGNGGSAATASHFACDLAKCAVSNGKKPFRVISLSDSVPLMTAWANDSDYSMIFSMQMEPLLEEKDVVIGISGSGNSSNVLRAIESANLHGAVTIGMTGFDGGLLRQLASHCLLVNSFNQQHVEDVHLILVHLISSALRDLNPSFESEKILSRDIEI
jgi:D-sedoheptulose 7-phosphate isomerase